MHIKVLGRISLQINGVMFQSNTETTTVNLPSSVVIYMIQLMMDDVRLTPAPAEHFYNQPIFSCPFAKNFVLQ